jgi:hypothetical protein
MFLLYSDAFIESVNINGKYLGVAGVLELLNQTDRPKPTEVIPRLRESIASFASENLLEDDATLILGHFTATKVRMRDNFMAPFRLMREVSDHTQLETR